ncbi:hypothetical protein [Vibrio hippocampi]|uniref:Uncharacterized protein n=1 Tax=Vibrio hippocampi TaxID=654686 RepID=A0ABN8DGY8_9VIBR|nr:hypothetical protein [Vibrio hippocampi]CAH0525734.1 hypothetical protein VHP8226_01264 [Vibrio hippocampi]
MRAYFVGVLVFLSALMACVSSQAQLPANLHHGIQLSPLFTEAQSVQQDSIILSHKPRASLLSRNSLRINPPNKSKPWLENPGRLKYDAIAQFKFTKQAFEQLVACYHYLIFPYSHRRPSNGEPSNLLYRFMHAK